MVCREGMCIVFIRVPSGKPTGHRWTQEELEFYRDNPPIEEQKQDEPIPPVKPPKINCARRIGPVKSAPSRAVKVVRFKPYKF